jgi:FMN-dependent oxidoreductase (nitrilotriacetate monooxygenase family)
MFHMGWFLTTGFGVYQWNGPWSGNASADVGQPGLFIDMATQLERAGFDYMMLEDSVVLPNVFRGTFESSVSDGGTLRFDPMPLVPLLAQATSRLGIIATLSTTFYPPFLAARMVQTLDHVSNGRVGINLVTSSNDHAAQNFGLDMQIEHDERYARADEWIEVVSKLWTAWEPDAVINDVNGGVYIDHTKVHTIDFEGKYFRSRGPLNLPPGPQGKPVVCQAGGSPAGREFGARHADTIIATASGPEGMKEYRSDITERMIANGRNPTDAKVLYLIYPVLADTQRQADEKYAAMNKAIADNTDYLLAGMSYFTSTDFSKFDLDAPFPDISGNNGHQSVMDAYAKSGKTLRESINTHRVQETVRLVGTPDSVAAQMGEYLQDGYGDGYLVSNPVTRKNISEIADGLAPALRKRGLIRTDYEYPTFRENLLAF